MEFQARRLRAGMLGLNCHSDDAGHRIELAGELDLANASVLEAELERALRDGTGAVVVDMSALTFIDSTGIALLVAALGHDDAAGRLGFVPSPAPAVTRVLALTGVDVRLPRPVESPVAAVPA